MTIDKKLLIPVIILVTLAITISAVTAAVLNNQQKNIPATGTIKGTGTQNGAAGSNQHKDTLTSTLNIAIYTDAATTSNCTNINWGVLNPGGSATKTVFIKNTGSTQATLSISASRWTPASASSVLTLSWDKEGSTLAPGVTVPATITLQVAQDTGDLSTFNLDIVISGSAQ